MSPVAAPRVPVSRPLEVLVIDRNPQRLKAFEAVAADLGLKVYCAYDAGHARFLMREAVPQVALSVHEKLDAMAQRAAPDVEDVGDLIYEKRWSECRWTLVDAAVMNDILKAPSRALEIAKMVEAPEAPAEP